MTNNPTYLTIPLRLWIIARCIQTVLLERCQALKTKYIYLSVIGILTVLIDQFTKIWAKGLQFEKPLSVIDGFWQFRYAENRGAAWGIFSTMSEGLRIPFFFVISMIAMGIIIFLFRKLQNNQRWLIVALSFVLGGATGNFIDRIFNRYVIDFIDMYYGSYHWPTYNMADVFISTGVAMLIIEIIMSKGKSSLLEPPTSK